MTNRKTSDYENAKKGIHQPVENDDVHAQAERDRRSIREGGHTELADNDGVPEQSKKGRGYSATR